jgi:hypothetical protein
MKLAQYHRPSVEDLIVQGSLDSDEEKQGLDAAYQALASLLPFPQQKNDDVFLASLDRWCFLATPAHLLDKVLDYLCNHFSVARGYLQAEFLEEYQGDGHDVGYFEANSEHGGHLVVKKIEHADGYMYVAVLIHEFMHFLMHHYELDLSDFDEDQEEILTDLMAIFTGFGKVMALGYFPTEDQEHQNLFGFGDSSIGYLSVDEISYIEKRYVLVTDARIK